MEFPRILLISLVALGAAVGATGAAQAVDGCTVLLCLAGNWRSIGPCVPPVRQAFKDALHGSFPTCSTASGATGSGATSVASNLVTMVQATAVPDPNCPPHYVRSFQAGDSGTTHYSCQYTNAVTVAIGGAPWSTTYFVAGGAASVTYFHPAALASGALAQSDEWLADVHAFEVARAAAAAASAAAAAAANTGGAGG